MRWQSRESPVEEFEWQRLHEDSKQSQERFRRDSSIIWCVERFENFTPECGKSGPEPKHMGMVAWRCLQLLRESVRRVNPRQPQVSVCNSTLSEAVPGTS